MKTVLPNQITFLTKKQLEELREEVLNELVERVYTDLKSQIVSQPFKTEWSVGIQKEFSDSGEEFIKRVRGKLQHPTYAFQLELIKADYNVGTSFSIFVFRMKA